MDKDFVSFNVTGYATDDTICLWNIYTKFIIMIHSIFVLVWYCNLQTQILPRKSFLWFFYDYQMNFIFKFTVNGQSFGCGWTLIRIFDRLSELSETTSGQSTPKRLVRCSGWLVKMDQIWLSMETLINAQNGILNPLIFFCLQTNVIYCCLTFYFGLIVFQCWMLRKVSSVYFNFCLLFYFSS